MIFRVGDAVEDGERGCFGVGMGVEHKKAVPNGTAFGLIRVVLRIIPLALGEKVEVLHLGP